MTSRSRPALAAALAVAAASLAPAAAQAQSAPAKTTQKKAMWGPVTVDGVSQFPAYRDLGVGIFQYPVVWSGVAPTRPTDATNPNDPAYVWPADLDLAASEAQKYGIRLALRVWKTPGWANGGRPNGVTPTQTKDYTDFLVALSRRYPSVRLWLIGEEPNIANVQNNLDLTPSYKPGQLVPSNKPLTSRQRGQIRRYATVLDASYARLKQLSSRNLVVGGNVTSCGGVGPQRFMQGMRLANGRPARMDLFGINPYSPRRPDLDQPRFDDGCADFADLDTVHGWTGQYLSRTKAKKPLRIFVSEMSDATDVPSYLFGWHVTQATQARFITQALRITRRTPWIYTYGWYTFQDLEPRPDGEEARQGLVTRTLAKKPGYYAYKRG